MPTIKDNLNAIKAEIREISTSAKDAANNTKTIGENLKFDPTNVQLVADRFAALKTELKSNTELVAKYKKAIADLSTLREGLDTGDKDYAANYAKLTSQINSYSTALKNAELKVTSLNAATEKHVEQQALVKAAVAKTTEQFSKLEQVSKTLSVVVLAIVGVFTKLASSALETGQELYSLSKRYNASVEDIQTWNRALQLATGESDLFTNSISVMVKGMSQIVSGRGVAYQTALNKIGVSYKEIAGLDTEEQFRKIVEGLASVANASDRAAYAQTLFGEAGQYIASQLSEGTEALNDYFEKASKFAVITQDSAEKLNAMNLELKAAKSQISLAGAELTVALAPALMTIAGIITDFIAPTLENISNIIDGLGVGGQKVLLILLTAIIILPKLVLMIEGVTTAIRAATKATTILNVATATWRVFLLAVVVVLITIVSLVAIFSKTAKNALTDVNNLAEASNALAENGVEFTTNVENYATTSTDKTVTMNVDIHGEGDTAISDESAMTVAQLTVDQLQKSLGDLIK